MSYKTMQVYFQMFYNGVNGKKLVISDLYSGYWKKTTTFFSEVKLIASKINHRKSDALSIQMNTNYLQPTNTQPTITYIYVCFVRLLTQYFSCSFFFFFFNVSDFSTEAAGT